MQYNSYDIATKVVDVCNAINSLFDEQYIACTIECGHYSSAVIVNIDNTQLYMSTDCEYIEYEFVFNTYNQIGIVMLNKTNDTENILNQFDKYTYNEFVCDDKKRDEIELKYNDDIVCDDYVFNVNDSIEYLQLYTFLYNLYCMINKIKMKVSDK